MSRSQKKCITRISPEQRIHSMNGSYCFCFRRKKTQFTRFYCHFHLEHLPFWKIPTHSTTNMIISRPFASKQRKVRLVPPFVADVFYANTRVIPFHWPGQCGERRRIKFKLFRFYFTVGELPVGQEYGTRQQSQAGLKLKWYIHPAELNYFHYLPIFFDGWVGLFSFLAKGSWSEIVFFFLICYSVAHRRMVPAANQSRRNRLSIQLCGTFRNSWFAENCRWKS